MPTIASTEELQAIWWALPTKRLIAPTYLDPFSPSRTATVVGYALRFSVAIPKALRTLHI